MTNPGPFSLFNLSNLSVVWTLYFSQIGKTHFSRPFLQIQESEEILPCVELTVY
jgi:hypothetical protein